MTAFFVATCAEVAAAQSAQTEAPEVPADVQAPETAKPTTLDPATMPKSESAAAPTVDPLPPPLIDPQLPPPVDPLPPPSVDPQLSTTAVSAPPAAGSAAAEASVAITAPSSAEPLAGFTDGVAFIRSSDNSFILFPSGRVDLDGYAYAGNSSAPNDTFLIRRARIEATGWVAGLAYFSIAGDYVGASPTAAAGSQSSLAPTDDYVAIAPWRNLPILQVGQFDAPFMLENRTVDTYLDFMERSMTVRDFGVPDNKEVGAMIHGTTENRTFFYSYGVFNGDGPNLRNVDRHLDSIARAWIAPFSIAGNDRLHDVEIGGSGWLGDRATGLALASQTTQGGFQFSSFDPYHAFLGGAGSTPVQLRQVGLLKAFAAELNAPVAHRFGLRGEVVWRHSPLSEENLSNPAAPVIIGGANLTGWSTYGELWFWVLGDDRIVGDQQGLEPFKRYRGHTDTAARNGLMIALRFEHLDEEISHESDAAAVHLGNPALGETKVTSVQLGVNYWLSRRFRASANYGFNHLDGTTAWIGSLATSNVHEVGFRLGVAL